ncbi:MAG: DsbC family protein [Syntrophales bacterium]|nr:DsbC family protein [Syntrophales bacterium]
MRKTLCTLALSGIFLAFPYPILAMSPEEALRRDFPNIKALKIHPAPIGGLYEVVTERGIIYYDPISQNLIVGEIITREGRNLTQERRLTSIQEKAGTLPLQKALKMGSGPQRVIEFSNPDCSYCRQASKHLSQRKDLTRYVFFLPFHPRTEHKIRYILCAKDRVAAYEEAMAGKLDGDTLATCQDATVEGLLKEHREAAKRLGIDATPFFIINGKAVQGADIPRIDQLLGTLRNVP